MAPRAARRRRDRPGFCFLSFSKSEERNKIKNSPQATFSPCWQSVHTYGKRKNLRMCGLATLAALATLSLPSPRAPPASRVGTPQPPLSRRAALAGLVLSPAAAASAAGEINSPTVSASGDVMHGVLQASAPLPVPSGGSAVVTLRVVGRNTNGPLATATVPLQDGAAWPLAFAVERSSLREARGRPHLRIPTTPAMPCPPSPRRAHTAPPRHCSYSPTTTQGVNDFMWEREDLFVRADILTAAGKTVATGRSKAKAIDVSGTPGHGVAYVTIE